MKVSIFVCRNRLDSSGLEMQKNSSENIQMCLKMVKQQLTFRVLSLTNAVVSVLLKPSAAHTPSNRNEPLALSAAVHLWCVSLLGVVHTLTSDLHERGRVGPRDHIREDGQVASHSRAAFVVHSNGHHSDAGSYILKRQVEAALAERPDATDFSVELESPHPQVHVSETLVGSDGVDLGKLTLPDGRANIPVGLVVVEVKGLLAGSENAWHAVAVSQSEFHLDVDPPGAVTLDPVGPEPVVLARAHHVAHLVRVDGAEILVHFIDCIPLCKDRMRRIWVIIEDGYI